MISEKARLAQRRAIRESIAQRKLLASQIADLQKAIAIGANEIESATAEHAAKTAELHKEVSAIDAKLIAAAADSQPASVPLMRRRRELLGEVERENLSLEKIVITNNERARRINAEIHELSREQNSFSTENQLASSALANPEWFDQRFAHQQLHAFAEGAARSVGEKIAVARDAVAQAKAVQPAASSMDYGLVKVRATQPTNVNVAEAERHLRRWQCVLDLIHRVGSDALRADQELHRQIIAE